MKTLKKQRMKKMSNTIEQVGGTHYQNEIQPWDIIAEYKMNWFQGEILKYVTRFKHKGGKQDLEKAISIADKANDININGCSKEISATSIPFILQYIWDYTKEEPGDLLGNLYNILNFIINGRYDDTKMVIISLIKNIYGEE